MNFKRFFRAMPAPNAQIVKIMKLLPLLLTIALVQVRAESSAQITLKLDNVSLYRAMKEISSKTDIYFTYGEAINAKNIKVTINITDADLETAMTKLLQGTQIGWEQKNNTIVLFIRQSQPSIVPGIPTDTTVGRTISGKVYSENGEPLGGASVKINSGTEGAITGNNGDFILHGVDNKDVLTVSYTGFVATSEPVGNRKNFNFFLVRAVKTLDAAVVQGYGTTTDRVRTGNITTIRAEEIGRQVVMNPLEAIKGKVPGLVVTSMSALSSGNFRMELRGRSQINFNIPSEPLIIVDDVPITILEQPDNGSYETGSTGFVQNGFRTPAGGQGPLFSIDPDDIETISILKDADATAIYGARGARGVILIKTKKGKIGRTTVEGGVKTGISYYSPKPNLLNTSQYIEMRREAYANSNRTPNRNDAYDFLVWDSTKQTYWPDKFWGKNGGRTDAQLTLSGGDRQTQFRISGSHTITKGINSFSGADSRSALALSLDHKTINQKFEVSFTSFYSFTKVDNIALSGTIGLSPTAPEIFKPDGTLNYDGYAPVRYLFSFANLLRPYVGKTGMLNASTKLTYHLTNGLKLITTLGYSNVSMQQESFVPIKSQDPLNNPKGSAQFGTNFNNRAIIEPIIEYQKYIGPGKLQAIIGGTYQSTEQKGSVTQANGYTNDNLLRSVNNAASTFTRDNGGAYKYVSCFTRINYNVKDRYILTLTGRRDGSSRFGPGKRFGNFGSVGAAWIFSETGLIKSKMSWLSFGKIRTSYGTVGSDLIGDYGFLERWNASIPYNNSLSYIPVNHSNPD